MTTEQPAKLALTMRLLPALLLIAWVASAQQPAASHPRDSQIHDADTKAWWHTTEVLSSDAMQGRDTGTAAYQRAADYVAQRFQQAGLKPAGDHGTWFQTVPMHDVTVERAGTSFTWLPAHGPATAIPFLEQISITAAPGLPTRTQAALTFRGYCGKEAMQGVAGKLVLCFGTQRAGLPTGAERAANARAGHALGILSIDDPGFTLEPPRWPDAYARRVTLASATAAPSAPNPSLMYMRLSDLAFARILAGSGHDAAAILKAGASQQALASFDLEGTLKISVRESERALSSPNILAVLPGSDPTLKAQYVVVAAHLDGYGFGTPVMGDALYNGALDDAAYVALLIQFADNLHAHPVALKRSILFCAFTGEEKGLLGSRYFVAHPTVPIAQLAADINLDQLRPLFPLRELTALAMDDTTLGQSAKDVATPMGIKIKPDTEPERHLLQRADHYPFLQTGVPAIGFIFGYEPGTDAERRYREWYRTRYHRPQDDVTQPLDFDAAARFDRIFYALTEAVANDPNRPAIKPGSHFSQR